MSTQPQPQPGSPTHPTRERLVETAAKLFHERGYHATGVATILREAGVHSGSLYHHFANKEELLKAVLDRYEAILRTVLMEPIERVEADPIERIFRLLGAYRQGLHERGCGMGCPIGNLALEVSDDLPAVRAGIDANFAGWQAAVAEWIEQAGTRLPPDVRAEDLALFTLTTLEGGIMLSRAARSLQAFDSAVRILRDYFRRLADEVEREA